MDTRIVETIGSKHFNSLGEEVISCGLCGRPTTMLGTKRCDGCWELETRIHCNPELARKILADIDKEK